MKGKIITIPFAIFLYLQENMTVDPFHSYKKLANEMKNITISYSKKGSRMNKLRKQIMQYKNWLKGTHQKCADEYLFAYVREYEYRFNKRNMRKWLFNDMLGKMMHHLPHPYQYLKTLCVYNT